MVNAYKKFIIVICSKCGRPSIHPAYYRPFLADTKRKISFYRCPWCGYHGRVKKNEMQEYPFEIARARYRSINFVGESFTTALNLMPFDIKPEKPTEKPAIKVKEVRRDREKTVRSRRNTVERQTIIAKADITRIERETEERTEYLVSISRGEEKLKKAIKVVGRACVIKKPRMKVVGHSRVKREKAVRVIGKKEVEREIVEVEREIARGITVRYKKDITGIKVVGREEVKSGIKVVRKGEKGVVIEVDSYMIKDMVAKFARLVGSKVANFVLNGGKPSKTAKERLGEKYAFLPRNMKSSRQLQKLMGDILKYNGERKRVTVVFSSRLKYMSSRTAVKFAMTLAILSRKFYISFAPSPFTARILADYLLLLKAHLHVKRVSPSISPLYGLYLFAFSLKEDKSHRNVPIKRIYGQFYISRKRSLKHGITASTGSRKTCSFSPRKTVGPRKSVGG